MKINQVKLTAYFYIITLSILSSISLYISFPPYELYFFAIVSLIFLIFALKKTKNSLQILISLIVFEVIFTGLLNRNNIWYLTLASNKSLALATYFYLAAIFQYCSSFIASAIISTIALKKFSIEFKRFLILPLTFLINFFFPSEIQAHNHLYPLLALSKIFAPSFHIILTLFLFYLSSCSLLLKRKLILKSALITLFILSISIPLKENKIPKLIYLASKSFEVKSSTDKDFIKHLELIKSKYSIHSQDEVIWPEASFTFKSTFQLKPHIIKTIKNVIPGNHYLGIYSVISKNQDFSKNEFISTKDYKEMSKSFPVPFQEDDDLFWFINKESISLSFKTKAVREYQNINKRFSIFLCNEIFNINKITNSKISGQIILIPSNPPMQFRSDYEKLINFYVKVISAIENKPAVKISSGGQIFLYYMGKSMSEENYLKFSDKNFLIN